MEDREQAPTPLTRDRLVQRVLEKMAHRANEGMIKFGDSGIEFQEKPLAQWIEDAQEEAMDFIVYLERIKEGLK